MITIVSSRCVLLLAGAVGMGCASADESAVAPSTPAAAAPVDPAPVVQPPAPVTPTPAVTATPPATAAESAVPVAADAPRFTRVAVAADGDGVVALLRTTNDQLFAATGPVLARLGADGSYEQVPEWVRGVDDQGSLEALAVGYDWWSAVAMGGTWPEGAYLVLSPESGGRGEDSPNELYRRANGSWVRVATRAKRFDWYPRAFGPWKDGSLLALRGFEPRYSRYDDEGNAPASEVKAAAATIAKEKRLIVLRGAPKAPAWGNRDIRAFASLPTGEIYAAVADGETVTMLHHDDASGAEVTRTLPTKGTLSDYEIEVVATGDDRVWVFGSASVGDDAHGYVARFEGRTWEEVETPCVGTARSGSVDDAGNAYFVCDVQRAPDQARPALLRVRGKAVEELPTGIVPGQVVARTPADIWVVSPPFEREMALAHTGTDVATPHTLATRVDAGRAVFEWADPHPMTPSCQGVWIPLAPGADRAAAEKSLEAFGVEDGFPEVYQARLQGRTEWGITIRAVTGKELHAATKRVVRALGTMVGPPTCNQRPSVDPEG